MPALKKLPFHKSLHITHKLSRLVNSIVRRRESKRKPCIALKLASDLGMSEIPGAMHFESASHLEAPSDLAIWYKRRIAIRAI